MAPTLTAIFIVAGCTHPGNVSASPTAALNATRSPLLPTTAPGLPPFDEGRFQQLLGTLRGTPVVVNLWASWCGPCRAETPILARAARTYGRRIQFLGVDVLDSAGAAVAFAREFHIPYPSVSDPSAEIRNAQGLLGLPGTIFYDANGGIVDTVSGPLDPGRLSNGIQRLLEPPQS